VTESGTNRRKHVRTDMHIPVSVKGFETDGQEWHETTACNDVSYGGLSFTLRHPVVRGQVVLLNLALPPELRKFDQGQPTYRVYSLVRNVSSGPQGQWVRLKFLGKRPPKDYDENPACRYLLPGDPPPAREERRRTPRRQVFVNLRIQRTTAEGGQQTEQTVTENVGKGGACVLTSLPIAAGETLIVEEIGGEFRTQALVRSVSVGKDGVPRLHLRFENQPPDRLVPRD
jgi:hypothetical protein